MRIAIIGAGGVGLYLSHRLLGAGHEVVLRGRERTAGALGAAPLTLVSASGRAEPITAPRVVTVLDTREFVAAFDLVILATKAWQVSAAAAELPGSLTPTGRVLTTQNGVDAPARVAEHLPAEHVLGGALVVIAERLDPSTVRLIGAEGSLALGSAQRRDADAADQGVLDALAGAGLASRWTADLGATLWQKLALVASYGGVGALSGGTVGQTRAEPATRDLVNRAMREVFAVARADGAELGDAELTAIWDSYLHGFAPETTSSLQRDLAAGRPSELADQSGAVVRHAERLGLDAPVHRAIAASQAIRERAAREPATRAGKP